MKKQLFVALLFVLIPLNNYLKENRTNVYSFKELFTEKLQIPMQTVKFFKKDYRHISNCIQVSQKGLQSRIKIDLNCV